MFKLRSCRDVTSYADNQDVVERCRAFDVVDGFDDIAGGRCCTGAGHGDYGEEGKRVNVIQSLHAGLLMAMKSLPATQYVSENIPLDERPFRDADNKLLPCRLWR